MKQIMDIQQFRYYCHVVMTCSSARSSPKTNLIWTTYGRISEAKLRFERE